MGSVGQTRGLTSRQLWAAAVGLAAIAFVGTLVATRSGPGQTKDSIDYFTAARNLAAGRGFTDFTGHPMTGWPPGFPVVLRMGSVVGLDLPTTARLVNAAAFAVTVLLAFVLFRRHTTSSFVLLAGTSFVVFAPALPRVAHVALSEPAFCALVLVFVLLIESSIENWDRRWLFIVGAAVSVWAAFLFRYAGMSLLLAGAVALLIALRARGARAALTSTAVFLLVGASVPALWTIRNADSGTGDVLGARVPSGLGPITLARQSLAGFAYMVAPSERVREGIAVGLGAAMVAVLTVVVVVVLVGRDRGEHASERATVVPLIAVVGAYTAFATVSNIRGGSDLDVRILTPVFVPLVVLVARLYESARDALRERRNLAFPRVVAAATVAILMTEAVVFAGVAFANGRAPRGYRSHSELINVVKRLDPQARVFSNDPWALVNGTGRQPFQLAGVPMVPGLSHRPVSDGTVARAARCPHGAFLAWFGDRSHPLPRFAAEDLTPPITLTRIARKKDGNLYRVDLQTGDHSGLRDHC